MPLYLTSTLFSKKHLTSCFLLLKRCLEDFYSVDICFTRLLGGILFSAVVLEDFGSMDFWSLVDFFPWLWFSKDFYSPDLKSYLGNKSSLVKKSPPWNKSLPRKKVRQETFLSIFMCAREPLSSSIWIFTNVRGGPIGIFCCQMRLTRVELANGMIPCPKADHFSAHSCSFCPNSICWVSIFLWNSVPSWLPCLERQQKMHAKSHVKEKSETSEQKNGRPLGVELYHLPTQL